MCNRVGCWERGLVKRALERSLRARLADSDLEALQDYYIELISSGSVSAGMTPDARAASVPRG